MEEKKKRIKEDTSKRMKKKRHKKNKKKNPEIQTCRFKQRGRMPISSSNHVIRATNQEETYFFLESVLISGSCKSNTSFVTDKALHHDEFEVEIRGKTQKN